MNTWEKANKQTSKQTSKTKQNKMKTWRRHTSRPIYAIQCSPMLSNQSITDTWEDRYEYSVHLNVYFLSIDLVGLAYRSDGLYSRGAFRLSETSSSDKVLLTDSSTRKEGRIHHTLLSTWRYTCLRGHKLFSIHPSTQGLQEHKEVYFYIIIYFQRMWACVRGLR